jgi:hypothetical protein
MARAELLVGVSVCFTIVFGVFVALLVLYVLRLRRDISRLLITQTILKALYDDDTPIPQLPYTWRVPPVGVEASPGFKSVVLPYQGRSGGVVADLRGTGRAMGS